MAEKATHDQQTHPISVAEYLACELASPVKHEYVHGDIYAFAGTTECHNLIAGNIFASLHFKARGSQCRVLFGDVRLQAAPDLYYYPDVMVVCENTDDDSLTKRRPCLIVEVISPSTSRIDRHEKRLAYQAIASVQTYMIVDTATHRVTRHWRDGSNDWQQMEVIGEGDVAIPCPEATLTLADIYDGIS